MTNPCHQSEVLHREKSPPNDNTLDAFGDRTLTPVLATALHTIKSKNTKYRLSRELFSESKRPHTSQELNSH